MLARCRDNQFVLTRIVTAGLLDIDVLPGIESEYRRRCMPVVGRGDRQNVDALVLKNPSEIGYCFGRR